MHRHMPTANSQQPNGISSSQVTFASSSLQHSQFTVPIRDKNSVDGKKCWRRRRQRRPRVPHLKLAITFRLHSSQLHKGISLHSLLCFLLRVHAARDGEEDRSPAEEKTKKKKIHIVRSIRCVCASERKQASVYFFLSVKAGGVCCRIKYFIFCAK